MTSPYPLPEGCIFREDFINPKLAADNGVTFVSPTWLLGGGVTASYASLPGILPSKSWTTVFDVNIRTFTPVNTFRVLYRPPHTGIWGIYNNTVFYYDDYSVPTYSPAVLSLGRVVLATVLDSNISRAYVNGVEVVSGPRTTLRTHAGTPARILSASGAQSFNDPCHFFAFYLRAMSADEMKQVYLRIRGLKS